MLITQTGLAGLARDNKSAGKIQTHVEIHFKSERSFERTAFKILSS